MESDPWQQWRAFTYPRFGSALFIDSVERFSAEARKFLDGVLNASSTGSDAMLKFSDFLREQFTDVQPLWAAGFGVGALNAGPASPAASAMSSPALGATREHQQRGERMLAAGQRALDALRRLQRMWADALREAATAFTTRLRSAPDLSALEAGALRKLYDSWIDCAEEAYARAAHSDAFCDALADFVNASSQSRRELQASIEHWSKLHDLPTRSEVNTLTRRLRAIEDELDQLHAAPREPRAAAAEGKPEVAAKRSARPHAARPRAGRRKAKR